MQKSHFRILAATGLVLLILAAWWLFGPPLFESERASPGIPLYGDRNSAEADTARPGLPDYGKYAELVIPPLPPERALETFRLEEGFRIEIVAHEPDVIDPVAMDIDRDGRLWVVEMPSYMPVHDLDDEQTSIRERVPQGRVVVLEDRNGDGKVDHRRVFMKGLILPRAIKVLDDGVLIAEPPYVWFIQDTTGDGIGDRREMVSDRYGDPASQNVEHMPNGLFMGMDNWIHSAQYAAESLRRTGDRWSTRPFEPLAQWGMTQDDWGRLFSTHNTRTLNTHLVPYGYSRRHPDVPISAGIYVNIAESETMWPAHPTGVNRGYRINQEVREDGTLLRSTSTCGPVIYRGDQFGPEYRGDAFVPEPAANLIKRLTGLDEDPAAIETVARFAYEGREFLTSTDERFRPINMYNSPDGSLYVVDMYRGLFQHARFLTDHLRDYTVRNDLHRPFGPSQFGRIYRIVREECEINYNVPKLGEMDGVELTGYLRHENGWLRDQAQQLLVQRSPANTAPLLEEMARTVSEVYYTRLQALWTLEGFDRDLYPEQRLITLATEALDDSHPRIRAAAIRMLEPQLRSGLQELPPRLVRMVEDEPSEYVQLQLLATLGESNDRQTLGLMATLLDRHVTSPYFREMALNGVYLREKALLDLLRSEHGWSEGMTEEQDLVFERVYGLLKERRMEGIRGQEESHLPGPGGRLYQTCAVCHGIAGEGISGVGPPLAGSQWVTGDSGALVRIVLQGFVGSGHEEDYGSVMPAHRFLSDEEVADLLTYLRSAWGHEAPGVTADEVLRIREETRGRTGEWRPEELDGNR